MNDQRKNRQRLIVALVLLCLATAAVPAWAQGNIQVTNHIFTNRVIRTADGGFVVQDVLVGFERGTASFQTLTQLILPKGTHNIALALFDPSGKELDRISFSPITAESDGWTQSLEGTWRGISFQTSGTHEMILYVQDRAIARFVLTVG